MEPLISPALIPEMSGLVRPSIPKKIALHLDLEQDLPPIEADRGQVQQVFMNLVLNAAEAIGSHERPDHGQDRRPGRGRTVYSASPGGGRAAAGEIRLPGSPRYRLRHGRGHQGQDLRSVLLHEIHGARTGAGGGGRHRARPQRRDHSRQRARQRELLHRVVPGGGACGREAPVAARDAALQGAGVVLVVDDEPAVREMAKRALERHGYTVLLADSGLTAIDVFRRHPGEIALVILDLSMPNMGGEETLPELRKIRPEVKVVLSSGYSEAETMPLFQGQPVSGFIQKPYTSKGLAEKVKACLG